MTTRRTPRNTTADVRDNPLHFVAASMGTGGSSQAIEEQERSGQAQIVASEVLPVRGSDDQALLNLGFTFGDEVPGDDLFRQATLPPGWARQATEHAMHSSICDERGIVRVSVFYKAAFYDRRADMHVVDVGQSVASDVIYGDDPVGVPAQLTPDEISTALAHAEIYIDRAIAEPQFYGDRRARAQELVQALRAAQQETRPSDRAPRRRRRRRNGRSS